MSVFIPLIPEGPSYQLLTSPPKDFTLYLPTLSLPTFIRQGRKGISFPSHSTDIRRNWKIPCLGVCVSSKTVYREREVNLLTEQNRTLLLWKHLPAFPVSPFLH